MPAALCVHLPNWPIDLLRRRERRDDVPAAPGRPVLLVRTVGQLQIVAARCEVSGRAGVGVGMTLAHARALLPSSPATSVGAAAWKEPRVEPSAPEADAAALEALARWCTRLAPVVSVDPPDGLLMDVSGCERYYKGRPVIVRRVSRAMRRLGFAARIAMAPTFGCAWAMARFAGASGLAGLIVPDGRQREAVAPLPIEALRLDDRIITALREVAIDRVGDVLRLPRSSLAPRFGEQLLLRLDQALGDAMEIITPVRPPEPVRAEMLFDGPTTQVEALQTASRRVIEDLCGQLLARDRGARRVVVWLVRSDLPPLEMELTTSRPTCNPRHLWKLLAPKLERAHLGFGVEGVGALAGRLALLTHVQQRWPGQGIEEESVDTGRSAAEMIDALAARLGDHRVLRAGIAESHIPERAVHFASALNEASAGRWRGEATAVADSPRPTILLDPPESAEVIALWPDGPPSRLRWRGREMVIAHAAGPERITEEWWLRREPIAVAAASEHRRDYFRVIAEDGAALWLFRDHLAGRWFVHGLW